MQAKKWRKTQTAGKLNGTGPGRERRLNGTERNGNVTGFFDVYCKCAAHAHDSSLALWHALGKPLAVIVWLAHFGETPVIVLRALEREKILSVWLFVVAIEEPVYTDGSS